MNYKQQLSLLAGSLTTLIGGYTFVKGCVYKVEPGHMAFKFNRISGVQETTFKEGWHLKTPWFERPVIFNVKNKATEINSITGSNDLQQIKVTLRVLYRPNDKRLQSIYRNLGLNYDERIMPSVINEVLKSVVAKYDANQLLANRDIVSRTIWTKLEARLLDFNVLVDDVSITNLVFGTEYTKAIEAKQIAEQESQRAQNLVEKARQQANRIMVKAEGDAKAA